MLLIIWWSSVDYLSKTNKQTNKQIQVVDCRIIHFWLSNCHLIIWWSDDNITRLLINRQKKIPTKVVDYLTIHSLLLFVQPRPCYLNRQCHLWSNCHLCIQYNAYYADNAINADNAMYAICAMPIVQFTQCQLCIQCRLCNRHNANSAYKAIWFVRQCQLCVQCHLCNPYNAIFGLDIEK